MVLMDDLTEKGPRRTREEILQRAPLLRAYLDPRVSVDPTMWGNLIVSEYQKIDREMKEKLGENYHAIGGGPLQIMLEKAKVFEPSVPIGSRNGLVNTLTAIGFQIGNDKEINIFLGEISVQGVGAGVLNIALFQEQADAEHVIGALQTVLHSGSYWRRFSDGKVPDQFINYVNQLDF